MSHPGHERRAVPARRAQRGLTLVELAIAITIFGILASLAGPAFRDFVVRQRIRNAAYDLMIDLTFARSEAVKRNGTVTVASAESWTGGWSVVDAAGNKLRQHAAFSGPISITMARSAVDFQLNGRAAAASAFTIDDTDGKSTIPARCVSVDTSGRPRSREGACP